jgi:hypothetical protein
MTVQVRDALSADGTAYRLAISPIESFFRQHPERRPAFEAPDSSVWRGYVAEWAIEDGRLYLVRLTAWLRDESTASSLREVGLESIFPGGAATGDGRVLADWFSGELEAEPAEVAASAHPPHSDSAGGVLADWLSRDLEAELADPEPDVDDTSDSGKRVFRIDAGAVVGDASPPLPGGP